MGALKSRLGRANWKGVWGWALDAEFPDRKLAVEIVINDRIVGRVLADDPRPNLRMLPPEARSCGFQFLFPNGLSALTRHVVHARLQTDGTELEGSPRVVEADPGFDPALERTIANALDVAAGSATTPAELDAPLDFVVGQIGRLLQARERLAGGRNAALPPELAGLTERWSGALDDPASLAAAFGKPAEAGSPRRRALVVGDSSPVLDEAARMAVAHVASLCRLGLAVDFIAAECRTPAADHLAAIEATGTVYQRPPVSLTVEELLRRNRGVYDTVLLVRIGNYEKYAALARYYCPLARVIFDVDSLLFLRMLRRAEVQNWRAGVEKGEALRLREMMAAWGSHAVLTASQFEAALLRRGVPQASVHVVAWPLAAAGDRTELAQRVGVGLLGDFQSHADLDAAAMLIERLMPAVWAIDPSVPCVIAGCNMPAALRQLSRDGVTILDQRPGEAMAGNPLFDRVRLTVALQRAGAGLPPAVPASLAAGIPCLGTAQALQALALPDPLRPMVCDSIAELAAAVCRLHDDAAANHALAQAGLDFVAETFSAAAVDRQMLAAIGAESATAPVAVPQGQGAA